MNQEMALEIANAHNRIKSIHEQHATFLQHLSEHAEPEGLPAKITIQDQSVTVNCFGNAITAEPKVVMDDEGFFAIEYVFYVREEENEEELWRFYLTSNGRLVSRLEQDSPICDFNNRYVAKYICGPVMNAALDSILFKPTERHGG